MGERENGREKKMPAGKKSPWRFLFLIAALAGGLELLGGLLAGIVYLWMGSGAGAVSNALSLGVIGGADGPTAVFVTCAVPSFMQILVPVLLVAGGIWGWLRLSR